MKIRSSILILILYFALSQNTVYAQKVVVKNGIEYLSEDEAGDDLNSITAPSNTVMITVKRKKGKAKDLKNIEKVTKFVKQRKRLRFRSKRNKAQNKCFKKTKEPCSKKIKK